ncbi:MAG TPA: hypothetical protein VLV78_10850 [Thermoanaerobaculia bacterium]|nr:hypothetical protein [Thermoanaerobaculia bacterium]
MFVQRVLRISVLAVFLGACLSSAMGQELIAPVRAKLVIPDKKLLPGVPFAFWVELENASDGTISIGLRPHLLVQRGALDTFEVSSHEFPTLVGRESYLTLAPHEQRTLSLSITEAARYKDFYGDPRLSPPGHYRISLRLDGAFDDFIGPPPKPLTVAGIVLTDVFEVERVEPSGSDAAVWQRLQESHNQRWKLSDWWSGSNVIDEILISHPDSNYVPYAVLAGAGRPAYRRRVLETIDRFPSTPVIEELHVIASQLLAASADDLDRYAKELASVRESKRPTTKKFASGPE